MIDERPGAIASRDVAADNLGLRVILLHPLYAIEHALRMTVRGINDDDIHARFDQHLGTLLRAFPDANRGADPQAPEPVLGRERMLG